MSTATRRALGGWVVLGLVFGLTALPLLLVWSSGESRPKGGAELHTALDTTVVMDWTVYASDGYGPTYNEFWFFADTLLGKRYVIQSRNCSGAIAAVEVFVDSQQWVGPGQIGYPDYSVDRSIELEGIGTHSLIVLVWGEEWQTGELKIVRVNDPTYPIYGPQTFVKPNPADTQFATVTRADTARGPFWLRAINGSPDGSNRVTDATIRLDNTDVLDHWDFWTSVPTNYAGVTPRLTDTLSILNASGAGTRLNIKITATDSTPPGIALSQPLGDTIFTGGSLVTFSGTTGDETPGFIRLNSQALIATPGSFSTNLLTPSDGRYPATLQATNSARLTTTLNRTVIRDSLFPFVETFRPRGADTLFTQAADTFTIVGSFIDTTYTRLTIAGDTVANGDRGYIGFAHTYRLDPGMNKVTIRATDLMGHRTELTRKVYRHVVAETGVRDSALVGVPATSTGFGPFRQSIEFLYAGSNPVQDSVVADSLKEALAAVIRGRVRARDWSAVPNVTVRVLGRPEFGHTETRADGRFDLAVNGGGALTLRFNKPGFLESQRRVNPEPNDFEILDDVGLVGKSAIRTWVSLDSGGVVSSRLAVDDNGDRRLKLLFRPGTQAYVTGTSAVMSAIHVRATEYTIGADGPRAMPAELPPSSAYTYCVDLSADEADSAALANGMVAPEVRFTKPVTHYLPNFLHAPVGARIPYGYYDANAGSWIADSNAVVIKLVGLAGDTALVDVDSISGADTGPALVSLGIDDFERAQLGRNFAVGDTLVRTKTWHFSPGDPNPPPGPILTALAFGRGLVEKFLELLKCLTQVGGSIIECETCVLGQRIPLVGSPFTLNYRSFRARGYEVARSVKVPLLGNTKPDSLRRIIVKFDVAGKREERTIENPGPNASTTFVWDGRDAYGRWVEQSTMASIRIGYVYDSYWGMALAEEGFNNPAASSGVLLAAARHRDQGQIAWTRRRVAIGIPGTASDGLGGWTLSPHHFLDVKGGGAVFLGDGGVIPGDQAHDIIEDVAGTGSTSGADTSCGSATGKAITPTDVAVGPDGVIYIADDTKDVIWRLAPGSSTMCHVAGNGNEGAVEIGAVATASPLYNPGALCVGPDGLLYFAVRQSGTGSRVCRVGRTGTIELVAGNGNYWPGTDATHEGLAVNITLSDVNGLAFGPNGDLFIGEGPGRRVTRVSSTGKLTQYAGTGIVGTSPDLQGASGRARTIKLSTISDIAVSPDGTLYIAEGGQYVVRQVSPSGWLTRLAAGTPTDFAPGGLAIAPDGGILVSSGGALSGNNRIYRLEVDGAASLVTGDRGTFEHLSGDYAAASQPKFSGGIAVARNGDLYATTIHTGNLKVVRIGPKRPPVVNGEIVVPSTDGGEIFYFSPDGRHLRTRDALTGGVRVVFNYDANGQLKSIYDANGDSTTIARSGTTTTIRAPYGLETELTVVDTLLTAIANPDDEVISLGPYQNGLLEGLADAKNQAHEFAYHANGRLQSDSDPAGGVQSFSVTTTDTTRTVTRTTAEGRESSYQVQHLPNGAVRRTINDADGLRRVVSDSANGSVSTVFPTGLVVVDSFAQNAIKSFGVLAPTLRRTTTETPADLRRIDDTVDDVDPSYGGPNPSGIWRRYVFRQAGGSPFTTTLTIAANPLTRTLEWESPLGVTATATIDSVGRLLGQVFSGLSARVIYLYDTQGRLTAIRHGEERAWHFAYDDSGRVESVTDTLERTTSFRYDAAGRVIRQTLFDGEVIGFAYDANGNLTTLTPPDQPDHTFEYSEVDQTVGYTAPDVGTEGYTGYSYNDDHQLAQVSRPDGWTVDVGYEEPEGRLASIAIPRGTIGYDYVGSGSGAGQVSTISSPDDVALHYAYDGPLVVSERTSGVLADTVTLSYDALLRPSSLAVNGSAIGLGYDADQRLASAGIVSLGYNAAGLIDSVHLAATSFRTRQDYNAYGELQNLRHSWGSGGKFLESLVRDPLGRIVVREQTIGADTASRDSFVYSMAGRLEQRFRDGLLFEEYGYDGNGNRVSSAWWDGANGVPDTASATFDGQDRMIRYRNGKYLYNAAGELAKRIVPNGAGNDTTTYTYDQIGNLIKVRLPMANPIVTYQVDGRNRRVAKYVNGTFQRGWIWQDQLRVAAELDSSGIVAIRYVYGSRAQVPDYLVRYGTTYRIVSDQLGSVRMVVDASDQVVAELGYDAWGKVTTNTNPGFVSLGFAGGLYDHQTGLVRFGARDYDPAVGRWTCKDPVGFGGGSPNLYSYARGNPINRIDPTGLRIDLELEPRPPSPRGCPVTAGRSDPTLLDVLGGRAAMTVARIWAIRKMVYEDAENIRDPALKNAWQHAEATRRVSSEFGPVAAVSAGFVHEAQQLVVAAATMAPYDPVDTLTDFMNNAEGLGGTHANDLHAKGKLHANPWRTIAP